MSTATAPPVTAAPPPPPRFAGGGSSLGIDLKPLRVAGAGMFAVAAVRPWLPATLGPPCPLRTVTGVPCPFCGMTRGVTALVHGQVSAAFSYNPGAFLVVAMALVLLVAWRWQRVRIPMWSVFVFFAALWAFQLFKYATGRPL
ncbi:MAG TPA: DUF2752 domain-containing protein [Acidimicrobiia bacterium]|nr:DUF2752 domain-containing protein [Acidimicrobiia bacterium]